MSQLLFETGEWNFDTLKRTYDAIEEIAVGEMGLDPYPNQIELISSEQMLDAYSSIGMPIFYHHWSFGKRFARDETMYRKGYSGLAYEIVINSNPCISYIMEENTMTMQALVMAHAAFGHNHFFKNNYLFREQTDASGILDYLNFAKTYIARCEERYGISAVERILDAAHALMDQGVNRYGRRARPSLGEERARAEARQAHAQENYSDLWRTLPAGRQETAPGRSGRRAGRRAALGLPEENLLYFLEKFSPKLKDWERELLRIVRNIAQYFFPQRQTKVMNEGCATYVHYKIMNRLYDRGQISEGAMLEFLDQPHLGGVPARLRRPALFGDQPLRARLRDDVRHRAHRHRAHRRGSRLSCPRSPAAATRMGVLKHAWANFRDDSFIAQYLSPHLMRKMRLFKLAEPRRRAALQGRRHP